MMSEWQIAQAFTATLTSPGPGSASVTVSMVSGLSNSRQTAARIVSDMACAPVELRLERYVHLCVPGSGRGDMSCRLCDARRLT